MFLPACKGCARAPRRIDIERAPPARTTPTLGGAGESAVRQHDRKNRRSQQAMSTSARAAAGLAAAGEFNTHSVPPPERRFSPTGSFAHQTRGGTATLAASSAPRLPGKRLSALCRALHSDPQETYVVKIALPQSCRWSATIGRHLKRPASEGIGRQPSQRLRCGARLETVGAHQRFGTMANLNVHRHCLVQGWPLGRAGREQFERHSASDRGPEPDRARSARRHGDARSEPRWGGVRSRAGRETLRALG